MTAQHTPGPWTYEPILGQILVPNHEPCPSYTGAHLRIANMADFDNDEQRANARLIAAAPELLAVCEAVAKYFADSAGRMGSPIGDAARAAIAKATAP